MPLALSAGTWHPPNMPTSRRPNTSYATSNIPLTTAFYTNISHQTKIRTFKDTAMPTGRPVRKLAGPQAATSSPSPVDQSPGKASGNPPFRAPQQNPNMLLFQPALKRLSGSGDSSPNWGSSKVHILCLLPHRRHPSLQPFSQIPPPPP